MSWISNNYEKAAAGGAVLVALAVGLTVLNNKGAVEESFTHTRIKPNNNIIFPGLEEIDTVKESLKENQLFVKSTAPSGRKVNLMTGIALFAEKDNLNKPLDVLTGHIIHPDIPNIWWLENNIDPGFSDSPDRDPDEDGFTNKEEFLAKTDPNDYKSHPDPISKLTTVAVKTTQYYLKPSDYGQGLYKFKLLEKLRGSARNKMGADPIGKGSIIKFVAPLMKNRFKLKDVIQTEIKKDGYTQPLKLWLIEDLQPNKKGLIYQFDRKGLRHGDNVPKGIQDSVIELSLKALKEDTNIFKLKENVRFSLPYDLESKNKPYLLKKVDLKNKQVMVEYLTKEKTKKYHIMKFK